jgi:outer membrane protein assembly factor BamB
MSRSTTLPALPGRIASRREFLKRYVVFGTAISVMGSLLAACGDDDEPTVTAASDTATEVPEVAPSSTATEAAGVEPSSTREDATAESTTAPGSTPTSPASPSAEHPAVGALSITDGAVKWSVSSPVEAYRTVIGANDDIVLIEENGPIDASGSRSQHTIAFNAADGSERWRRSTGDTFTPSGPFDGRGIVVLADQDEHALVGVDATTGEEKWRVESSAAPLANSPTVAVVWNEDEHVGGPLDTSKLRGIDRVTGDELWVSDTLLLDQSGNQVAKSPAAVLGEVIAVPTGATLTALDMRTGAILWQAPQLDDPDAADGTIVGARRSNGPTNQITVTAIDAASGQERWTAPGVPSYGDLLAVGDGVLVVMDAGGPGLIAYELSSGAERWRATPTTHAQPQLISGTSLVMLWEGELAVLSTTDGATIWAVTEPFGTPLMNSVDSNDDMVFVAINSLPWAD